MIHKNRRFCLAEVATAEILAEKLTEHTWTLCTGFYVARRPDVVFLNDAFSEDGAQEYAVCRKEGDAWYQIESITFSWCKRERALAYVREALGEESAPDVVAERSPVGGVVIATSTADLAAALGSGAPPMHILVQPRIEAREEHAGRQCCA